MTDPRTETFEKLWGKPTVAQLAAAARQEKLPIEERFQLDLSQPDALLGDEVTDEERF